MTDRIFRVGMTLAWLLLLCFVLILREHDQASLNGRLDALRDAIAQQEWSLAEIQALSPPPCHINVLVVQPRKEP